MESNFIFCFSQKNWFLLYRTPTQTYQKVRKRFEHHHLCGEKYTIRFSYCSTTTNPKTKNKQKTATINTNKNKFSFSFIPNVFHILFIYCQLFIIVNFSFCFYLILNDFAIKRSIDRSRMKMKQIFRVCVCAFFLWLNLNEPKKKN